MDANSADDKIYLKVLPINDGFMIWWKTVKGAAVYKVNLYIAEVENGGMSIRYYPIDSFTLDKATSYYTFSGLADAFYGVKIYALASDGTALQESDHRTNIVTKNHVEPKRKK